ncbi:hypothetical protein BDA96_10G326800 [Sorghum bicolor]|jgi:hypothetical protein|uniref:Uncharacterized protein n=1 Tax=Sorghum bicolor TaxID=4558 RepID=A0A921U2Y2_SORBI|nr:proline-rich protein 2-like [Sorghum bicolor]KAG0516009.1 hypothetical protein BDA96_10G326800 [Sorghum bicolor]|eukprot:XP_021305605.1 proline-rich protein 2-like [Sorghum bicolor]
MPASPPRMAEVAPGDPGAPAGPHARADGGTPPPLPRPLPSPHDHPPNPRCHRATEGKAASRITVGACARACLSPFLPPRPPHRPTSTPPPRRASRLSWSEAEERRTTTGADAGVPHSPIRPRLTPVATAARSDRPTRRPAGAT